MRCRRVPGWHCEAHEHQGRLFFRRDFGVDGVTARCLRRYLKDQARMGYCFFTKNCKHFVYDLFRYQLGEAPREFPGFCEEIEQAALVG